MLDFTSVLYLGIWHPSRSLPPWPRLTTGVPAVLLPPPRSAEVAAALAALVGTERALLGPSTLHLFWDLSGILVERPIRVLVDGGAYAIARWGVERAVARRQPVHGFAHHDPGALAARLRAGRGDGRLPVVVADGYCPACARAAPVAAYLAAVRAHGGLLVLDDTQALGIFGERPAADAPYGRGGGGVLRLTGAGGPELLTISSLAKAFGAPIAVVAGSARWMEIVEEQSRVRVHCSPPSAAAIHAAAHALALNRRDGDARRLALSRRVRWFQAALAATGLAAHGGLFPVQRVALPAGVSAAGVRDRLSRLGVRTVVLSAHGGRATLVFVLTARHRRAEIEAAARALGACLVPSAAERAGGPHALVRGGARVVRPGLG